MPRCRLPPSQVKSSFLAPWNWRMLSALPSTCHQALLASSTRRWWRAGLSPPESWGNSGCTFTLITAPSLEYAVARKQWQKRSFLGGCAEWSLGAVNPTWVKNCAGIVSIGSSLPCQAEGRTTAGRGGVLSAGVLRECSLQAPQRAVFARMVWHLIHSTCPSRGKHPFSSASMDKGFPQS